MFGGPSLALPVTQWVVNHVMHLSAFVPVSCLSGGDKAGRGDARLGSIVPGCCQAVTSVHKPPPTTPTSALLSPLFLCSTTAYFATIF